MARLSGLQRDVLSLYRQCLRALKEKPMVRKHTQNSDSVLNRPGDKTPFPGLCKVRR
jgi:hypothetical protein